MRQLREPAGPLNPAFDVQRATAEIIRQLVAIPILDGEVIEDIEITSSGVTVAHALQRVPIGWIPVRVSADVRLWDTGVDETSLTLDASGTATISIWVF